MLLCIWEPSPNNNTNGRGIGHQSGISGELFTSNLLSDYHRKLVSHLNNLYNSICNREVRDRRGLFKAMIHNLYLEMDRPANVNHDHI